MSDQKQTSNEGQVEKEYDGSTPARVNIPAIATLVGADRGLERLKKRQVWVKSRRLELKSKYSATSDKGTRIRLVDEDKVIRLELPTIKVRIQDLETKRDQIVADRAGDAEGYAFPDVE